MRTLARPAWMRVAVAPLLLVGMFACVDGPNTIEPRKSSRETLAASVVGRAAAAVTSAGLITLAPAPGRSGEIAAEQAIQLGNVWARLYLPSTQGWIEKTHGAKIVPGALRNCGRPLYARSAFADAPSEIPAPFRRAYGNWWLLTYCSESGEPTLSVAVSAGTEATVSNGRIKFPRIAGNDFFAVGIPLGHVGEYPLAPEAAIELAAGRTGKRVASVPELVTPPPSGGPPQFASWRLELEGPAIARTASGNRSIREAYVRAGNIGKSGVVLAAATEDQPASATIISLPLPLEREKNATWEARIKGQEKSTSVPRRADTPVRFEPITPNRD